MRRRIPAGQGGSFKYHPQMKGGYIHIQVPYSNEGRIHTHEEEDTCRARRVFPVPCAPLMRDILLLNANSKPAIYIYIYIYILLYKYIVHFLYSIAQCQFQPCNMHMHLCVCVCVCTRARVCTYMTCALALITCI
jgi:hypothetical protein